MSLSEPAANPPARSTTEDRETAGGQHGSLRWWPVMIPVVIVLVGAWSYRWVDEDAFINFRIIDNLLAGHGLVFNLGERVEVNSDPLWLFTLVVLHEIARGVALEWLSVILGLVCTGAGFITGGRAVQRLAGSRTSSPVFPLGLLLVAVVAGVWEFSTSGLEMSMVFLWLGASFLLLVRLEERRRRAVPAAVVIGLGTLIRPELALGSVVFMIALVAVVAAPGWSGRPRLLARYGLPIAAALALPVLFEVFRAGYYALLVPNTALAKAGGAAWWSQGFTYLWNFVAPYTLWLPLALAVPLVVDPVRSWWRRGDRIGVVVLAAPMVVGLVQVLYVVRVGGDYMHARLLLPGFFAVCLPIFVTARQARSWIALPLVGIVVWAGICAGWLRFVPPKVTSLNPQTVFISNERNSWISATGNPHPIRASDYDKALSGTAGTQLARLAAQVPPGHQRLLVITDPFAPIGGLSSSPARSDLPFTLAVNVPAIGVIGYLAGPDVYLFDSYSLANPIGSHTQVVRHARPGHEKYIGPAWMVARFGIGATVAVAVTGGPSPRSVGAAGRALGCSPLADYLHAITAPIGASRFFTDIGDAYRFTVMSFSADPSRAATQLCGTSPPSGPTR